MGTVKYTGPVASFHCPTNAEIRSLKVHFSPKQEGSGDPSPENVRPIVGWDGVNIEHTKNNLAQFEPYGTGGINLKWTPSKTILDTSSLIRYSIYIDNSNGGSEACIRAAFFDENGSRIQSRTRSSGVPIGQSKRDYFTIQPFPSGTSYVVFGIKGSNFTIKEPMIDIFQNNAFKETPYEPYRGSTMDYEFGVLGKNKFNWDVPVSEASPVSSNAATAREFTLDTYIIGMSVNNYYRQNYANWVLNPSVENGVISFSSGAASGYGIAFPLKLAAGQTYFLSGTSNGVVGATYYNEDGELISYQNGRLNKTITVPDNAATTLIGFYANTSNTDFTFSNIQLELGSTATAYEPYDPNKTVYGGWVDLISGEVQEDGINGYPYYSIVLDGTEEWTLVKQDDEASIFKYYYGVGSKIESNSICSHFKMILPSYTALSCHNGFVHGMSGNLFIQPTVSIASTVEEFKSYLESQYQNGTPVTVLFQANKTPNTYHLAPTQLQTFLGQNNVWSNADYVEVEYDLYETQDILTRKQFIIANQPHVVKSAAASLQNFVTDMKAPLKECKVYFSPVQDLHGYDKPWVGGAGKNLFNINTIEQNPDDMTAANTTARNFVAGTYCVGTSWSNLLQPNKVFEHLVSDGILSIKNNNVYGVGYALKVEPETDYTISATSSNGGINAAFYDTSGNFISGLSTNLLNTSFATPVDAAIIVLTFYNRSEGLDAAAATFSNIQFEKGSTATSYRPYENICPISGWNEIEATRRGRNLFNLNESDMVADGWNRFFPNPMKKPGEYTISCHQQFGGTGNKGSAIFFVNQAINNAEHIGQGAIGYNFGSTVFSGNATITEEQANASYILFGMLSSGCTFESLENAEIQIELGSTATDYEPYSGVTIPITFPSVINILNSTTITANKTLSAAGEETSESGMSLTDYIKVNEGDTYKLTFTSKEGARTRRIWSYNANKEPIEQLASTSWVTVDTVGSIQATISSGAEYIRICYKTADENIFLEGPESSVIYGGYVDLVTGEVWETHEKINLPVTAMQGTWDSTTGKGAYWYTYGIQTLTALNDGVFCNRCEVQNAVSFNDISNVITWYTNGIIRWIDIGTMEMTVAEYRNYLAENPLQVTYKLNTPVLITTLTPTQLKTLKGINNIWSDANGPIEVKYWTH